jgi:hypothetical protein
VLAALKYPPANDPQKVSPDINTGFELSHTEQKSPASAPRRARATEFVAKQQRLAIHPKAVAPKARLNYPTG